MPSESQRIRSYQLAYTLGSAHRVTWGPRSHLTDCFPDGVLFGHVIVAPTTMCPLIWLRTNGALAKTNAELLTV
jgi:hypothetical protein